MSFCFKACFAFFSASFEMDNSFFALAFLIVISFFACQEDKQQTSNALDAIPIDAALILEANDLSKSLNELSRSAPWELLTTETSIKINQQKLLRIDSALTIYASQLTSINPLFISLHLTGAQSLNWLATTSLEDQEQKFQLLEIGLKNFANIKNHPYEQRAGNRNNLLGSGS